VITAKEDSLNADDVLKRCREKLPAFMLPAKVDLRNGPLPRNPNGKIDRKSLSSEFADLFERSDGQA